jgi:hypothetical protein
MSNLCATVEPAMRVRELRGLTFCLVVLVASSDAVGAQTEQGDQGVSTASGAQRVATVGLFVAGAALGLLAHEGAHLVFDVAFDADPGVRRVDFHGIPFFAITHRQNLSPTEEFVVSAAGFWAQQAGSEWLLTRRPRLRHERAPLAKGLLAFNVLASGAYAGAAFFRTGPIERDTRGMGISAAVDERWIGAIVLAPAVFDTWRYFRPGFRPAIWMSRAAKIGGALLVIRAASR